MINVNRPRFSKIFGVVAAVVALSWGTAAQAHCDTLFETLVRVHRAGEGAPYTGLKPAGEIEPAIAAADKSIATGKLQPVARMIVDGVEQGLHKQYDAVMRTKKHDPNDVTAARAHVGAYVEYVHYVERLHNATQAGDAHAAVTPAAAPAPSAAHKH